MDRHTFQQHIKENSGLTIDEVKSYYVETYKGIQFKIFDPSEDMVDPVDIAHALSGICRYNAHLEDFYSVGHHCIAMHDIAKRDNRDIDPKKALLHDAAEAYIADIPSPVKEGFKKTVKPLEKHILGVIFDKFGLSHGLSDELKQLDKQMVRQEKKQLIDGGTWWSWLNNVEDVDYDLKAQVDMRRDEVKYEMLKRMGIQN